MSETRRYFEWNYDTQTVREYERSGECNGCGQCCIARIRYRYVSSTFQDGHAPLGNIVPPEGVWFEANEGDTRRFMQPIEIYDLPREHACPHLDADTRCAVHHLKDWKRDAFALCDVFPLHPSQVAALSECSYSFRLVREGAFEVEALTSTTMTT